MQITEANNLSGSTPILNSIANNYVESSWVAESVLAGKNLLMKA